MIDPKRRPEDLTPEELAACRRRYRRQLCILTAWMAATFLAIVLVGRTMCWYAAPLIPLFTVVAGVYGSMMRCPVCGQVYSMSGIWKRPFGVLGACPRCGFSPWK